MTSEPPQQRTFPAEAVRIGDADQIQSRRSVMSAAAYEAGQFRTMCWANRVPSLGMMKHEFSSRTGRSREPWPNGGCVGPGTMRDEMRPSHEAVPWQEGTRTMGNAGHHVGARGAQAPVEVGAWSGFCSTRAPFQSQPFRILKNPHPTFLRNLGESLFIATVSFVKSRSRRSRSEVEVRLEKHSLCKRKCQDNLYLSNPVSTVFTSRAHL